MMDSYPFRINRRKEWSREYCTTNINLSYGLFID